MSIVVLAVLGAASGCVSSAGTAMNAGLGEIFRLQFGQTATVEGRDLEIVFEAVEADSRCPKGEACVWEGDAIVRLSAKGAAGVEEKLELHTASKGPASVGYNGWSIRLVGLEPYPVTGRTIPEAAYVVTLEVTHGTSAEIAIQ
jgi:hypothetical protein